jgi:cytochrome c oxidase subunit 3
MPAAITHTPVKPRQHLGEPGTGGKPPVSRRPTGGGGGGGDDGGQEHGGPRELLLRVRFYVFSALTADMGLFALLVAIFFASHTGLHLDPRTHERIARWPALRLPSILYFNTLLLLASCLTMEVGRRNIFREIDVLEEWLGLGHPALRRTLPWTGATLGLGALFLAGQALAWWQLTARGFAYNRWTTPTSSFFYLLTGLHAAHLLIGLLALTLCLCALRWLKSVKYRQIAVDASTWYWHMMGLTWVGLLLTLALGQ